MWFDVCERLNRLAHRQLNTLVVAGEDRQLLLRALLFIRGLSSYQAALILAERGLTTEARTIARGCFETVFLLGAIDKQPQLVDNLIVDDVTRKRRLAAAVIALPEDHQADEAVSKRLSDYLSETEGHGSGLLKVEQMATIAGMKSIYDLYYRSLSNDAAHPSLTSLRRHVSESTTGDLLGFHFGHDVTDMLDTISAIATLGVYITRFAKDFVDNGQLSAELDLCWEMYKSCNDSLRAASHEGLGQTKRE